MKQIVQNLNTGKTILEEVPVPNLGSGQVLIKTHSTLVSLGTEKMLVSFGNSNLLNKIKSQPEKVNQVIDKIKSDGLIPTYNAVNRKLNTPIPLGYSQSGEVVAVSDDVFEFKIGDRVISNGNHAEYVVCNKNLVTKIPNGVSYEEASFGVVGSIALQGIRLLDPKYDETIVVMGLGLIGLITAQLLISSGCNVVGIDIDKNKRDVAKKIGIKTFDSSKNKSKNYINELTNQFGADGVIITASSKSNSIIKESAQMCRKRGKIILVGVIGLNLDRSDFYEKEISFQVSCSYGPGRYDKLYEEEGIDYPLPYVRWTEKRNFDSILRSIKHKKLDVKSLISRKVNINNYLDIYGNIEKSTDIACLLFYDNFKTNINQDEKLNKSINISNIEYNDSEDSIAVIGSGNFTSSVILPSLKKTNLNIKYLISSNGLSSTILSKKYKIPITSTDVDKVLNDDKIKGVIISTRHDSHADLVIKCLNADKNVFVEKPLCLNRDELDLIKKALTNSNSTVVVGFNRRFSPYSKKIKSMLGDTKSPMNIVANINAGYIPYDHWVHDLKVGGGRIIGEACHFIDLISFFVDSDINKVSMVSMGNDLKKNTDNVSISLKYKNGSLGVINYFSNGNKSYSKERFEIFYDEKNLILDNFRSLSGYGYSSTKFFKNIIKSSQDKGHQNQFNALADFWISGEGNPILFESIYNTTLCSFLSLESLIKNTSIKVK
tara:strand:- start:5377 stop:7527 length:2151 start_codon:yes stop_codon:yes gene_type:complete